MVSSRYKGILQIPPPSISISNLTMSNGSDDEIEEWMICTTKDVYPDANQLEQLIVSEGTELISVLVLLDRKSHDMGFGCFSSSLILFKVIEDGSYHKFPEGPTGYWMRKFCDIFSEFQGKWVLVELPSSMEILYPSNPSMWWRRTIVYNDDDDDIDDCSTHDSVTSMTSDEDEEDMDGIRVMNLSMACGIIINYGHVELVMGLVTGVPSVMYRSENIIDDDLDNALYM